MPRIKEGDLYEVNTPKGKAYFQLVYHDPVMGHLIRVFPGIYPRRPNSLTQITETKELFFTFFPLSAANKQKIVEQIGNFPIPLGSEKPQFMRQALSIQKGGSVLNWRIINMDTGEIEVVDTLTENQKLLSLRECWNDTLLIERICDNWEPKQYS